VWWCSFTSSTESNPDTRRVPHQAAAAVLTDDPRRGLVFRQNCTSPDVGDVRRQSPEAMGLDGFLSECRPSGLASHRELLEILGTRLARAGMGGSDGSVDPDKSRAMMFRLKSSAGWRG